MEIDMTEASNLSYNQELIRRANENFLRNFTSVGGWTNVGLGAYVAISKISVPGLQALKAVEIMRATIVAPMGQVGAPLTGPMQWDNVIAAGAQALIGAGFILYNEKIIAFAMRLGLTYGAAVGTTTVGGAIASMYAAALIQAAYQMARGGTHSPSTLNLEGTVPPEVVDLFREPGFAAVFDEALADITESGWLGSFARCFLPGTPILMADGTHKPIEQIRIGDLVLAFDPASQQGRGALTPSRVTRTFQNTTRTVVDLRGLRMTPGHVCLTGEGGFATIAAILATDGTLVQADGTTIRARTGARLASPEDALVRVAYTDPATGALRQVTLRAGIPCAADGLTLAAVLAEAGYTTLADGSLRTPNGEMFDCADWPAGTTPLDTADQQNWVVMGPDGQPYAPAWMQGLEEEAGMEQAVGATTRTLTAGPGARPAFRPHLVGGTLSGLPAIGTAIGRMH